ncbi:hypothetical protein [uncultured Clostridium sp.]|uniref:hypothetical protein n=1 Tax=uncultured Clostridium sp. TaxID=59620 RepID=UPI0028EE60FC|nr:hypothetical protein [uncultured Clostridium sp.]
MMLIKRLFNSVLEYLEEKSNYIQVNISIPKDIFLRTELICKYISKSENCSFDISTFIILLYLDFIKDCIENYNPKKLLDRLRHEYVKDRSIIISNGYENYQVEDNTISYYNLSIIFDKEEAAKGNLILDEIFELFHTKFSFNTLIEKLWIGFIQTYKYGDNRKAFNHIRDILKDNIL